MYRTSPWRAVWAITGFVAGVAVGSLLAQGRTPSEVDTNVSESALRTVLGESTDAIVAFLDHRLSALSGELQARNSQSTPLLPQVGTEADNGFTQILGMLERLEAQLRDLPAILADADPMSVPGHMRVATNNKLVDDYASSWRTDNFRALKDLFGLSTAQLYLTLGQPSFVQELPANKDVIGGRVKWYYAITDPNGDVDGLYLVVSIVEKYVGSVAVGNL